MVGVSGLGGFGAGFFAWASDGGHVARAEHFQLGPEECGGEHGAEEVADGAGDPHAREPVAAALHHEVGDDEHQRDEEEDLAREGGDDGDPRLVDRLEELRIGDGEGDERHHHVEVAHGRHAEVEEGVAVGEGAENDAGHDECEQGPEGADNEGDLEGEGVDVAQAVVVSGAVVVAGDGLHALAEAEDEHDEEGAVGVDDAVGAHGEVAAVADELPVEEGDDERGGKVHQEGAEADEEYVAENVELRGPGVAVEADEGGGADEVEDGHDGGGEHREGGSPGGTADAPAEDHDEEGVEEDVEHGAAGHDPHALGRVAAGADEAREVEGEGGEEHAGKDDLHVLAGIGDGVRRGAEKLQYAVHEEVAAGNEEEAEEEG